MPLVGTVSFSPTRKPSITKLWGIGIPLINIVLIVAAVLPALLSLAVIPYPPAVLSTCIERASGTS